MASDKITQEQRRGIHERARQLGYAEGIGAGINQLAAYVGPSVGAVSVYALVLGMEAKQVDEANRNRFTGTAWPTVGIETLEDMSIADDAVITQTQPNVRLAGELIRAIDLALPVFNLQRG